MKSNLTRVLIAGMSLALCGFAFLHDDFIALVKDKLATYNKTYPEERVYLHLDKTLYKPGEDIWYKLYLVDGSTMKPSTVSSVAYVELIDGRGNVLKKSELYVSDGTSHGEFSLDEDLPGGLYTVRGYTRWMQNFPEEAFFAKEITIQSVITPRLLLKIDFEKKAYGKNDIVSALLKVRNLKDQPLADAHVTAKLMLDGNTFLQADFTTNNKGEATLLFTLPNDLNTIDGLLQAVVSSAGVEESISRSVPIVLNKIQLRFFPEGGEIVAGAGGHVAFEAINEFGKGVDVDGIIVDESGRTVTTFASYHQGMGAFTLPAEAPRQYKAKITRPQGITEEYPLPATKPAGLALSIDHGSDSIITAKVYASSVSEGYLVGHVHGKVMFAEKLALPVGWTNTIVSTRTAPTGIITFTLFDREGTPACERLAFINRNQQLNIDLKTDRDEYAPGQAVKVAIKTTDASGAPVQANLSVAVVDDQLLTLADDKQHNILSWLLLGSEVKGRIEEPSFYFNDAEPKATLALDYLLMVRGWRRFTWKEVFAPGQTLAHLPENDRNLSGFVMDPVRANGKFEVILLELNSRQRIAKVKTDQRGHFMFRNVDASAPMVLLTKKPRTIEVNGMKSTVVRSSGYSPGFNNREAFEGEPILIVDEAPVYVKTASPPSNPIAATEVSLDMSADVQQLSEVVVVGYGLHDESKGLTGSISVSTNDVTPGVLTDNSLELALQGRLPGVIVTRTGHPGSGNSLAIRGTSSLAGSGQPLYVIDGVPMSASIDNNFTVGSQITPGNIRSISVLKAADATALFGCMSANGAILIETKTRGDASSFRYVPKKPKYSILRLTPREFTISREFYSQPPGVSKERENFATTVYWRRTVVTDKNGEAKFQFSNNDAVSAFRITAEGFTGTGIVGRKEHTYHTLLPFSLDTRIPNYLGFEDTLKLPLRITNNTKNVITGRLALEIPSQLRTLSRIPADVQVEAGQTITIPVSIVSTGEAGRFPLAISLRGNNYNDKINQVVEIQPVGFPVRLSHSGRSLNQTLRIPISDMENGSLRGDIVFVDNVYDNMIAGSEALLREPHGCFEQVSSSTFPNILALQLLRTAGKTNPEVERKAMNYITAGYKQLKGYEIPSGGFEWFGNPPAHEALSAFGLIEFTEMKKVYPQVSEQLIARTREWLMKRRAGDGTFRQNRGKYGFSGAPQHVNDAYIVYALTETGTTDITDEYNHSLKETLERNDMYLAALMANSAANLGKTEDFQMLKNMFAKAVVTDGLRELKAQASITYSRGQSLKNETVALWALALMRDQRPDYKLIVQCLDFIDSNKSFGTYGATQATYLALKAIAEYYTLVQRTRSDGTIRIIVNNGAAQSQAYTADNHTNIRFDQIADQLVEGDNLVTIQFNNTNEPLPYSLNLTWNSRTPQSSDDCELELKTRLRNPLVKLNETTRLNVKLRNKTNEGLPMSMAVVGIPAGLSLQPWQLKELKERGAIDHYDLVGNKLAIYYREMGPAETKEVNLDLKAELPGTYRSAASCAYLYYTNEYKHWVEGTIVRVE